MHYIDTACITFYLGVTGMWRLLYVLPWPTRAEWFRWFVFLVLGKLVWFTISSKVNRKNGRISENGAVAGVSSLFDNH